MTDAGAPGLGRSVTRQRLVIGAVAGVVPGVVLATLVGPAGILLGVCGGGAFAVLIDPARGFVTYGTVGAAAGIPAWILVSLTAIPLTVSATPRWTPSAVRMALPALGVWLTAGAVLGLSTGALDAVATRYAPDEYAADSVPDSDTTKIVVAGGGFVGLAAARRLEQTFGPDPSVELTIVSRDNATLFTPMLAEVAGGSVSPTHITTPLRTALQRTRVIEAAVVDVDTEAGSLWVDPEAGPRGPEPATGTSPSATPRERLSYDHLILGLGAVPDDKGIDPDRESVLDFKTLGDAIRIRNHVIGCLERAEQLDDPTERAVLTRFVVAGGGFAGVELAGAINDLAHGLLPYYPHVPRSDIEVVLVHSRERILPELGDDLAEYALDQLQDRGVRFELGVRVADADAGQVTLSDDRTLEAGTVVWTAGNRPHPLVESLDVPTEGPGAVTVDETLSVPDVDGLWAAGDCAAVRDSETGELHPNTAQHAIRAGAAVAENVHAAVTGGELEPFSYRSQGTLAVIGHQVAVAEVMGRQFSGRAAWLFWRVVYLGKLPGIAQKIRVGIDWVVDLFFPRNLVRTIETRRPRVRSGDFPSPTDGDTVPPGTSAAGNGGTDLGTDIVGDSPPEDEP